MSKILLLPAITIFSKPIHTNTSVSIVLVKPVAKSMIRSDSIWSLYNDSVAATQYTTHSITMISSSTAAANNNGQTPAGGGLKTYFKTPEGRYKLHYEKTHPAALLHYAHGKTITQVISLLSFLSLCVIRVSFVVL